MLRSFIYIPLLIATGLFSNATAQVIVPTDSLVQQNSRKSFKTFIPGIVALGYGVTALGNNPLKDLDKNIRDRRNEKRPDFHTYTDDYLRYVPYLTIIGLEALGVKGKNELSDKAGLALGSATIAYGSVFILKRVANKTRPSGVDNRSFPSGHATIAFAGAEMINQEYGDLSPWYSIAGYTIASATSVLRVYNNDHWFSDVVAGAGVGILSTKLMYLVYPSLRKMTFNLYPSYQQQTMGFTLSRKY